MKKLLMTILFLTSPAWAYENLMIISPTPVTSVQVKNEEILKVRPVFTIDNEKKFIIVTPQKSGRTQINVVASDGNKTIEVSVTRRETNVKLPKGFASFGIDMPPEGYDIPLPPNIGEIPAPPTSLKGGK